MVFSFYPYALYQITQELYYTQNLLWANLHGRIYVKNNGQIVDQYLGQSEDTEGAPCTLDTPKID